jgi:hypothetical protein
MKTLKITLALAAVLLLTVSGVKSEDVAVNDENPTYKGQTNYDLLAHDRKKVEAQSQG